MLERASRSALRLNKFKTALQLIDEAILIDNELKKVILLFFKYLLNIY